MSSGFGTATPSPLLANRLIANQLIRATLLVRIELCLRLRCVAVTDGYPQSVIGISSKTMARSLRRTM